MFECSDQRKLKTVQDTGALTLEMRCTGLKCYLLIHFLKKFNHNLDQIQGIKLNHLITMKQRKFFFFLEKQQFPEKKASIHRFIILYVTLNG